MNYSLSKVLAPWDVPINMQAKIEIANHHADIVESTYFAHRCCNLYLEHFFFCENFILSSVLNTV